MTQLDSSVISNSFTHRSRLLSQTTEAESANSTQTSELEDAESGIISSSMLIPEASSYGMFCFWCSSAHSYFNRTHYCSAYLNRNLMQQIIIKQVQDITLTLTCRGVLMSRWLMLGYSIIMFRFILQMTNVRSTFCLLSFFCFSFWMVE